VTLAPGSPAHEVASAQRFYFRLLYCRNTVEAFRAHPERVLRAAGLKEDWARLLPDCDSRGHRAEMHGRRLLAAQELQDSYRSTLARIIGNAGFTEADIIDADWFQDFLGSPEFLNPRWSLPHSTGIGRGYEGLSRFFFWARDYFGLAEPGADRWLRDDLYLDFAAFLDQAQANAVDPFWNRLRSGFFWRVEPGQATPCRGLTKHRQVFRSASPDAAGRLAGEGLVDLDRFSPDEESPDGAND